MIDPATVTTHLVDFWTGIAAKARKIPSFPPLSADLGGVALLPTLFTVGTMDPLLDSTVFVSSKWLNAGGERVVKVCPEASHTCSQSPED